MPSASLDRLAIHTITTKPWAIETSAAKFAAAGVKGITVWRDTLAGRDIAQTGQLLRDHGLSIVVALPARAADPAPLRVGVEGAYPPFSSVGPDGQIKGFDIDIAKALCEQIKAQCMLVQLDFDGMIPALQARKIDMIVASMSITPERLKVVDFSDKYYYPTPILPYSPTSLLPYFFNHNTTTAVINIFIKLNGINVFQPRFINWS